MDLLKALSEMPAAPGCEDRVRDLIRDRVEGLADSVAVDALGNLICFKRANADDGETHQRVMVSCHMDEIAFYVRAIDEDGFLRVKELGGFDVRNLFARQVLVQGREDLYGILNPSGPPVHLARPEDKKKLPQIGEFFVDTGLPVETVQELVRVGDPVTLVQSFRTIGELATGKCLDNRAACWVGVRTLEQLETSAYDVYFVFSVQEEVGVRGATTAAYALEPDIGIAIDVTLAMDVPGTKDEDVITRLGKGVAIKVMDGGSISDRRLVETFVEVAKRDEIPYQLELLPAGATDARGMQLSRQGVRVITLSVPCRYIHTVTETLHQGDLRGCSELLGRFLATPPGES